MAVIWVTDFVLMIDQTKIPIFQLHVMDVPDVPGIVADQGYIICIRHNHRKILPVDCLKFFCGKHDHHLAPGSATI
jgi:hypothetical protein